MLADLDVLCCIVLGYCDLSDLRVLLEFDQLVLLSILGPDLKFRVDNLINPILPNLPNQHMYNPAPQNRLIPTKPNILPISQHNTAKLNQLHNKPRPPIPDNIRHLLLTYFLEFYLIFVYLVIFYYGEGEEEHIGVV